MWSQCLYVVEQWFSELRTQTERIAQLHCRQLQQYKERLRLCALTTLDKAFPDLAILPHLSTVKPSTRHLYTTISPYCMNTNGALNSILYPHTSAANKKTSMQSLDNLSTIRTCLNVTLFSMKDLCSNTLKCVDRISIFIKK